MSLGIYGTKKLANISPSDVDIMYSYSEDRNSIGEIQYKPLFNEPTSSDLQKSIIDGVYKLRIPSIILTGNGYYSFVIKPRSFMAKIEDFFYMDNSNIGSDISLKSYIPGEINVDNYQTTGIILYNSPVNSIISNGWFFEVLDNVQNSGLVKRNNFIKYVSTCQAVHRNNLDSTYSLSSLSKPTTNHAMIFSPDLNYAIENKNNREKIAINQDILVTNNFVYPYQFEFEKIDQNIITLGYGIYGNSMREINDQRIDEDIYTIFEQNIDNNLENKNKNNYKRFDINTKTKTLYSEFSGGSNSEKAGNLLDVYVNVFLEAPMTFADYSDVFIDPTTYKIERQNIDPSFYDYTFFDNVSRCASGYTTSVQTLADQNNIVVFK